ncbi:TPA: hypothetical protein HA225_05665 [Candidatus Micrarchaeota archaeon]|nr:hypothetical protein [Candidatus Micrarchaeota archaeon]
MDNEFLLYDQQAGKYPVSSYDPARFNYQQELYSLFQLILDAKGKQ